MYVTLTDIQNGDVVALSRLIENERGVFEVALCGFTYSPLWYNMSPKLQNNRLRVQDEPGHIVISDGYYNVCDLDTEIFKLHGASLELHSPSGRLKITTTTKKVTLSRGLGVTLGFVPNSGVTLTTYSGLSASIDKLLELPVDSQAIGRTSQQIGDTPRAVCSPE